MRLEFAGHALANQTKGIGPAKSRVHRRLNSIAPQTYYRMIHAEEVGGAKTVVGAHKTALEMPQNGVGEGVDDERNQKVLVG